MDNTQLAHLLHQLERNLQLAEDAAIGVENHLRETAQEIEECWGEEAESELAEARNRIDLAVAHRRRLFAGVEEIRALVERPPASKATRH